MSRARVAGNQIAPVPPKVFSYSPWRHGGWYVDNVRYPSGAYGCVSCNYPDKKWRIVCDDRDFNEQPTFPNRDAAALAEWELTQAAARVQPPSKTEVIFRKWPKSEGGGVIALFPCEPTSSAYNCQSFEHIGQHGAARLDLVLSLTQPARPEEYANLKRELESAPYFYNLDVRQRAPSRAIDIRRRKL